METKERKGEGRGRLSPGKKMAPLGPGRARLPATPGRVASGERHGPTMLPAMLVAALAPQGTQLQREESPGCSCHVSPSIPKCKWQPQTPRAEEATGLRLRPRPLTVLLARPPAPSAARQPSLSSHRSPTSGPKVRVEATLPALVCPVCGLLPQASPQEPRAGLHPLGEQGPEGNREPDPGAWPGLYGF